MVMKMAHDPAQLTVEFLCELHRVCMKTSKYLPVVNNESGELEIRRLNIGVTRQTSRKNTIIEGPPRVQFCPFENVQDELRRFTNLARQWLKNWKRNPFATAAWLHLVFVSCHPFEDGNGRVARLIASIPLIEAGLPPLCIPPSAKKAYYEGLGQARENNFEPLIQCFFQALTDSASTIENFQ
jgi:Fic family protein